jgi:hypothetical protein
LEFLGGVLCLSVGIPSEHVLVVEKLLLFDAWETMSLQASENVYHLGAMSKI